MEQNVTKKILRSDVMSYTGEEHNEKVAFDDYKVTRCIKLTFLGLTTP